MKRTHHCNELRPDHVGQTVTLEGWVYSSRDLSGVIFVDVRDREGRTQVVFDPSDLPAEVFQRAGSLWPESVVRVTGPVRRRPAGTDNPRSATDQVEVVVRELTEHFEEFRRGRPAQLLSAAGTTSRRGDFVVLVEPTPG